MNHGDDFISWVSDPARTNDELFTVEILLEMMRGRQTWPFNSEPESFEERMERQKARGQNPAYRPTLSMDEVKELVRQTPDVTYFNASGMSDRRLRDLTALRFFPALGQVNISHGDVRDLSPVASLGRLT